MTGVCDGDGTKDGAEHAGVVTAFDGETITIRQSKGPKLTATLDHCNDVVADSSAGYEVDLGEDDEGAFEDVEVGTVVTSAEFETRGRVSYLTAAETA